MSWEIPGHWCESGTIVAILEQVERLLGALGLAERFLFAVTSDAAQLTVAHPDRVVVIQTSDESHGIPAYANDVFMVFKFYQPFGAAPATLRALPLGCNHDVPGFEPLPIAERPIDGFFCGREVFREEFFAAVDAAFPAGRGDVGGRDLNLEISRAPGFRQGMVPATYGRWLTESNIAFCPRGVSYETFRIYEALRAGAVVIANRQVPSWFTQAWPVIEIDDWQQVKEITDRLWSDAAAMQKISDAGRAWWDETGCPNAVAHYLVRECVSQLIRRGVVDSDTAVWRDVAQALRSGRATSPA